MQELLDKSNVKSNDLKRYLFKRVSFELNNLTEPCYYPKMKKDFFEILNYCGLTEKDIKTFIKTFYKGSKAQDFKLVNQPDINLLIFVMYYFLNEKDLLGYTITLKYIGVLYYMHRINLQIPYCNPGAFKTALEKLPKIHLFSREGSIPGAILFMSSEMERKHLNNIKDPTPDSLLLFIQEYRGRIAQSIRSFGEIYHDITKEGGYQKTMEELGEDREGKEQIQQTTIESNLRFSEEMARKICLFKFIDHNIALESEELIKVPKSSATLIINELSNYKYFDNVKICVNVLLKKISSEKIAICDKEFYEYIKYLTSLKRSSELIYYKQQIFVLLEKILETVKIQKLNPQYKFNLGLFLAYYIGLNVRKKICG